MAIGSFGDRGTEDINYARETKAARRTLPVVLHERARIKLARLHAAETLADMASLPGNRFESLKGDRKGQYSVRINDQYRICFEWEASSGTALNVVITNYH